MLSDLDCQRKMICEVYQDQRLLGELGVRARHSFDFLGSVHTLKLPYYIENTLEEFEVRKHSMLLIFKAITL